MIIDLGIVGLEVEGAKVRIDRLVEPPLSPKRIAQVVVGLGIAGLDIQGPAQAWFGFLGPAQRRQRCARLFHASALPGANRTELR